MGNTALLSVSSVSRMLLDLDYRQGGLIKNGYQRLVSESKLELIQNNRGNSIKNFLFEIKVSLSGTQTLQIAVSI